PDPNLAGFVVPDGGAPQPNTISGSVVIEVGGEEIGIVGATTPALPTITSTSDIVVSPSDSDDIEALAGIIQETVDELTATGINKIILLTHMQQISIEIDRFIFNTTQVYDQDDFGEDRITDFDIERDIIVINRTTFTAIDSEDSFDDVFATVTSDSDAATEDAVIVYNTNNGNLFYNQNGNDAGLGSGGVFVTLDNAPVVDADNFSFVG
ncbi:MAG: hypothetical protein F6K34_17905, partial [Okeania sp. SIO4D6]|nr:hypothetical protein [Okeania sp. SIO4D6]